MKFELSEAERKMICRALVVFIAHYLGMKGHETDLRIADRLLIELIKKS